MVVDDAKDDEDDFAAMDVAMDVVDLAAAAACMPASPMSCCSRRLFAVLGSAACVRKRLLCGSLVECARWGGCWVMSRGDISPDRKRS